MPVAEIIAIGTELLLGEIQDTNTHFIARLLRDVGIDLYRTTIVGDNAERIAHAVQDAAARAEIVLTTGGLGPTVDDPTRQAVALAAGVDLEYRPELWDQIVNRFQRYNREPSENNRRQAFIPRGSQPIENQVGTAPCFITEINGHFVISLPGVPREMEFIMEQRIVPFLHQQFDLQGTIKARVLHLSGVGESVVDEQIGDLELLTNPTVGLAAHTGQIDVRITAKAASAPLADQMIAALENEIRGRVGELIYGVDDETLSGVVLARLHSLGLTLAVVDIGTGGEISRLLVEAGLAPANIHVHLQPQPELDLASELNSQMTSISATCGLGAFLIPGPEQQELHLLVVTPHRTDSATRYYGGPPASGPQWSFNTALDALRRTLSQI